MLDVPIPIRSIARVLLGLTWLALVVPWVAFALGRAATRHVVSQGRALLALRYALATHVVCPRGHRTETRGVFECATCHGLFAGWAFGPCLVCWAGCGHIACDHRGCGLAIRNPTV